MSNQPKQGRHGSSPQPHVRAVGGLLSAALLGSLMWIVIGATLTVAL